jgi:hypothetical protein
MTPLVAFVHIGIHHLSIHAGYNILHSSLSSISYTRLLSFQPASLSVHWPLRLGKNSGPLFVRYLEGVASSLLFRPADQAHTSPSLSFHVSLIIRSQNTTIRLPLLQILLAINRSARLRVIPVLCNLLNALCDKRRQLEEVSANSLLPESLKNASMRTLKPAKSGHT